MKIVAFSDLHLHSFRPYSQLTPEGLNNRLLDAVSCIDQVREHAEKINADLVLFGGDFWHVRKNIETAALNQGLDAIARFKGREIIMIHGNHDQAGKQHSAHPFSHLPGVTVADEPGWIKHDLGVNILAIPYTESREQVRELCNTSPHRMRGMSYILLAHLGVQGAKVGSDFVYTNLADCSVGDLNTKAFDLGLLGHYHLHQKLAKNLYYVGAPLQHNWGDRGQTRGFVEYDTETKKIKHIECKAPKFIELSDAEGWEDEPLAGNYVRLVSDEEYSADRREEACERLGARSFEVVKPTREKEAAVARSTLKPGESYDTIIEKYVNLKADDLDPALLAELGREIMKEVL